MIQKQYFSEEYTGQKTDTVFGRKQSMVSLYVPKTPVSPEREYIRTMNDCLKIINEVLKEFLPELEEEYSKEFRTDSFATLQAKIDRLFDKMEKRVDELYRAKDLERILKSLSRHSLKISVAEWKRAIKRTLGIDLYQDYYLGGMMDDILNAWVSKNVDLIVTIPKETLGDMKTIVLNGYRNGMNTLDISKQIRERYGISKKHAKFIARDQMAKLNGDLTKREQEDAGVTRFKWSTSGDQRVRKSHKALDGKIFEWANPPRNERNEVIIPGSDYNCRCVAIPVFDKETLSLPVEQNYI